MCGIAGFSPTSGVVEAEDYLNLLKLTQLNDARGTDATGIAMFLKDKAHIFKDKLAARIYVDKVVNRLLPETKLLLSHTRHGTMGANNKPNAHPYRYGHIVGIHNGVISNHREIGTFDVDSMAIFSELSTQKGDFVKALEKIDGSLAIAWVDDREPDVLYLTKNHNPLHLAQTERGIYFSSREADLELILYGEIIVRYEVKKEQVWRIEKGLVTGAVDISFKKEVKKEAYELLKDFIPAGQDAAEENKSPSKPYLFDLSVVGNQGDSGGGSDTRFDLEDWEANRFREGVVLNGENFDELLTKVNPSKCWPIPTPSFQTECEFCGITGREFRDFSTDGEIVICDKCLMEILENDGGEENPGRLTIIPRKEDLTREEIDEYMEEIYGYKGPAREI